MTTDGDDSARRVDPTASRDADRRPARAVPTARPPLAPAAELELAVVHYRDEPDRCTLFPADASGYAKLSAWLSADRSALCSLRAWR